MPSNEIHYNQLKVVGSHGCSIKQHKAALKLLESKKIKLDYIITNVFSLKNIKKAFKFSNERKSLKVAIRPN